MQSSPALSRRFVAGCCAASAISLIAGLFYVPNVVRVKMLDCAEGDTGCLPKETLGALWQDLPLPLAYATFGALCWVVLVSLCISGMLVFSRLDVAHWLQLTYLVSGTCLTTVSGLDAVYLVWGRRPGWGVLLVLVGLCLLAFASIRLWQASRPSAMRLIDGLP
jgi:hypothetical protein